MSLTAIRAALETALDAVTPSLATAWENLAFEPVTGTPYQRATLVMAAPDDGEIGGPHLEQGFLQVDLCYPQGTGPGAAEGRASLLKSRFRKGTGLSASGLTVFIAATPLTLPPYLEGDRYVLPVRIAFRAGVPD
jgi:hypothetical protein